MFVIAAVPEDPGLYQVLHRRGDGSFVHYGRVHSAKPKSKKVTPLPRPLASAALIALGQIDKNVVCDLLESCT